MKIETDPRITGYAASPTITVKWAEDSKLEVPVSGDWTAARRMQEPCS